MWCSNRLCLQLSARLLFVLFVFICAWWCMMHVDSSFGLSLRYSLTFIYITYESRETDRPPLPQ